MVRPIMKDVLFLRRKARPAVKADIPVADDLLDTLRANAAGCVGMAANMIGVNAAIIAFREEEKGAYREMFNPILVMKMGEYETEEGCLSLSGMRKTKRYEMIKVRYETRDFKVKEELFMGWTAQIIQHELDHLSGIII
ncbi:MAG: peptide deformylase [Clostridia bacterium]|nr:peptide deformylase [Clostridia bacterium]